MASSITKLSVSAGRRPCRSRLVDASGLPRTTPRIIGSSRGRDLMPLERERPATAAAPFAVIKRSTLTNSAAAAVLDQPISPHGGNSAPRMLGQSRRARTSMVLTPSEGSALSLALSRPIAGSGADAISQSCLIALWTWRVGAVGRIAEAERHCATDAATASTNRAISAPVALGFDSRNSVASHRLCSLSNNRGAGSCLVIFGELGADRLATKWLG